MEDVLDVYARAYDPQRPQICFDEKSVQLIAETRQPLPSKPGQPERFDYEYQRNGTANLFMFFQPLLGWRHVRVTDRRTKIDFAECMRYLVDDLFPEAETIVIVLDILNTHSSAGLHDAFEPACVLQQAMLGRQADLAVDAQAGSPKLVVQGDGREGNGPEPGVRVAGCIHDHGGRLGHAAPFLS
jgi:hypothetical protein